VIELSTLDAFVPQGDQMTTLLSLLLITVLLVSSVVASQAVTSAQNQPEIKPLANHNNGALIEGQGLLIDETRSIAGHNFISAFTQNFNDVLGERSTITIMERVDPQRGSYITITVDDALAFQSLLNPRQDAVEELAINAVGVVSEFIINLYASPTDTNFNH
jgi:hypothetical protein